MTYDIEGQPPTSAQIDRETRRAQKTLSTVTALKIMLYLSAIAATIAVVMIKPTFPFSALSIDMTTPHAKALSLPACLAAIWLATFLLSRFMLSFIEENAEYDIRHLEPLPEDHYQQLREICDKNTNCQRYNLLRIKQKRRLTWGEFDAMDDLTRYPTRPIKELSEMKRPKTTGLWYDMSLAGLWLIMCTFTVRFSGDPIFHAGPLSISTFHMGAVVILVALLIFSRSAYITYRTQKKDYDNYLPTLPPQMLTLAATSPELDYLSRSAIVEFLNRTHPGWSFCNIAPKNAPAHPDGDTAPTEQAPSKPIKDISQVAKIKPNAAAICSIAALVITLAAITYQLFSPTSFFLVVAEFVAINISVRVLISELRHARFLRQLDYEQYLRLNATKDTIQAAATSPELKKSSRKAIILMLNKKQKGWSFKHAPTLDSTAPLHRI